MTPAELRDLRKRLGLSQGELAQAVGTSGDRTIRKWENGERGIPESVAILVRMLAKKAKR